MTLDEFEGGMGTVSRYVSRVTDREALVAMAIVVVVAVVVVRRRCSPRGHVKKCKVQR